jgi:hypothetical protein
MYQKLLKPVVLGLVIIFFGSFLFTYAHIYDSWPHLDKIFHTTAGFTIAWFFSIFWAEELKSFNKFQRFIIFMGLAAMVGVIWEIMEFTTSLPPFVYHPVLRHYVFGGDVADTLGDLVADIFGASLFGLL